LHWEKTLWSCCELRTSVGVVQATVKICMLQADAPEMNTSHGMNSCGQRQEVELSTGAQVGCINWQEVITALCGGSILVRFFYMVNQREDRAASAQPSTGCYNTARPWLIAQRATRRQVPGSGELSGSHDSSERSCSRGWRRHAVTLALRRLCPLSAHPWSPRRYVRVNRGRISGEWSVGSL
jgi:hypothetical protein